MDEFSEHFEQELQRTGGYTLNDLTRSNDQNRRESYTSLKFWLKIEMCNVECKLDESLPQTMGVDTEETIKPDLCYWYKCGMEESHPNEEVLQIEVDSKTTSTQWKNMDNTCTKLGCGLIEKLLQIRRYDDTIMECVGYYFPASIVIRMKVMWKDDYMAFYAERECIARSNIVNSILHDLTKEIAKWQRISSTNKKYLPCTVHHQPFWQWVWLTRAKR